MRICFFGDSFVNGTGDDDAIGWPGRVVAQARKSGLDITYYNLGIRRDSSEDIANRWRHEMEGRFPADSPRRLAFGFGSNDCASDSQGNPRIPRERSLHNARKILQEAVSIAPTLMIGPCPILDDKAGDMRIEQLSKDLDEVCKDVKVPFLETFEFLTACDPWTKEARRGDGTHPNREGYMALADYIERWPKFQEWLVQG